jgi:hypothetical protein
MIAEIMPTIQFSFVSQWTSKLHNGSHNMRLFPTKEENGKIIPTMRTVTNYGKQTFNDLLYGFPDIFPQNKTLEKLFFSILLKCKLQIESP